MNSAFNTQALKKPTNVSINSDLLIKAKTLKINLSATFEAALIQRVIVMQRELWKKENKPAILAYNQFVDIHGTFSDDLRRF